MLTPDLIDPVAFAREERLIKNKLLISSLDGRLSKHEFLADAEGECDFCLQGGKDKLQRYFLALTVKANLSLICQRCLDVVPFHIDETSRIILFFNEQKLDEAMEQDPDLEGILVEPEISIQTLIEDQLIMALPLAPKHEDCGNPSLDQINQDKPNPFAVLANLKN
ncbi:YceD family protein [Neisseria sp. Ec49-e6-T10]|uniref:YceD family protein n=1 Tax=Neisseria sp. Ec49-e6-T10 TaxID=3140744 RepID=UPI003EB73D27